MKGAGGEFGDGTEAAEFVVGEDGAGEFEEAGVGGGFVEDVGKVADVGHDGHDEFFADGVDGRIGDLGEELVEVVEEGAGGGIEAGEGGVVAHGADGFEAGIGHGAEDEFGVFEGPAEPALDGGEVGQDGGGDDFGEEAGDGDVVAVDPAAVGAAAGI